MWWNIIIKLFFKHYNSCIEIWFIFAIKFCFLPVTLSPSNLSGQVLVFQCSKADANLSPEAVATSKNAVVQKYLESEFGLMFAETCPEPPWFPSVRSCLVGRRLFKQWTVTQEKHYQFYYCQAGSLPPCPPSTWQCWLGISKQRPPRTNT